ncbi:MAG TPA: type II toxin-antitoxin system RelE/ParE family toxin [Thermoanaerobaculia bacterium]|nr:type II toxin-antitoxin system RelE/ParE family toxin [Thermoanaerobaculia bacterium]
MADYQIVYKESARRDIARLDLSVAARIVPKIRALEKDPRPPGVKRIKGERALWRIRIGDWRVIYEIDDEARLVRVMYVRHRSKAYE